MPADSISTEFNEQSLVDVLNRYKDMNIHTGPVLMQSSMGMYAVHDPLLPLGGGCDTYTKDDFEDKFEDNPPVSYQQMVRDSALIQDRIDMDTPPMEGPGLQLYQLAVQLDMRIAVTESVAQKEGIELGVQQPDPVDMGAKP